MDRRRFLTTSGLVGLASLAGCNENTGRALGSVAPPEVPKQQLESGGWTLQDDSERTVFEQSYGPVTITAKAHSLTYTDTALAKRVKEDTLGNVSGTLATFAATRIEFSPDLASLPAGVGKDQLLDRVEESSRQQFRDQMKNAGLSEVSRTETGTLTVDTGETARYTGYEAQYEVGSFSFPLPNGEAVEVQVDPIAVAGDLAVWEHDAAVLVAGGAYPAENFTKTIERDVTDAVTVSVAVDLGLKPGQYQSEVRGLIKATR